jgi:hypothetical protein
MRDVLGADRLLGRPRISWPGASRVRVRRVSRISPKTLAEMIGPTLPESPVADDSWIMGSR